MNRILLGKFGKTHGVKGWVNVHTYTEFPEDLVSYSHTWWIKVRSDWSTLTITDHMLHNGQLLVKVDTLDTPEEAKRLTNQDIYLPRDILPAPEEGEFYWVDLEGLTVIDQHANTLGTIDHLFNNGAHSIIAIRSKTAPELLLPYIKDVVVSVDLEKKEMHVKWEASE